jgi:phage terminase large subunit-like protein
MGVLENFIKIVNDESGDVNNEVEKLDITTEAGYKKAKALIAELKDSPLAVMLLGTGGIKTIEEAVDETYEASKKEEEYKSGIAEIKTEAPKKDANAQISELVAEYVDSVLIKEGLIRNHEDYYNAKHELYEFAKWLLNK